MTYKKKVYKKCHVAGNLSSLEFVVSRHDSEQLISEIVLDVLERIEDCTFNQLGELIEKLKQEYK